VSESPVDRTVFITLASTPGERYRARLLIDSLRAFGGALSRCPVWLFEADPVAAPCAGLAGEGVRIIPLQVPDAVRHYYFSSKVAACAHAEAQAGPHVRSLVWLSADCLIVQPPLLFDLAPSLDATVRPVHIRNVGLDATAPLDDFWSGVYGVVGVQDVRQTVTSFIGGQRIRAYYNSHLLAVHPALGLLRRWLELFESLVRDRAFQSRACQDELHRVFLHQAALSALLSTALDPRRVRELPPDYSYPYNLHHDVPPARRAQALDALVCVACEGRTLDPAAVQDITIHEPLRSWLAAHARGMQPDT
jgi:hypothetical protein